MNLGASAPRVVSSIRQFELLAGLMTVSYRLFRRVILFNFPHDFLSFANRVGDDDLPRRARTGGSADNVVLKQIQVGSTVVARLHDVDK